MKTKHGPTETRHHSQNNSDHHQYYHVHNTARSTKENQKIRNITKELTKFYTRESKWHANLAWTCATLKSGNSQETATPQKYIKEIG